MLEHPRRARAAALSLLALAAACAGPDTPTVDEPDLGAIEEHLAMDERAEWPGLQHQHGRTVPLIRGFANDRPAGYWFLGFASRRSADVFVFCREGDDACPYDAQRRFDWARTVGQPVFNTIPGDQGYSPWWIVWRVTVGAGFEADSVKSLGGLYRLQASGSVRIEALTLPAPDGASHPALVHWPLVLSDTTLDENGGPMPDGSGPMLPIELRVGWNRGYRVSFFDFSVSDGLFPSEDDTSGGPGPRPLMPFSDIFTLWRRCDVESPPEICAIPSAVRADRRPVSERGLGQDITGDGDASDTNNVFAALPCDQQPPADRPYSPLWRVSSTLEQPGAGLALVDTTRDQDRSDITSAASLMAAVDAGALSMPELAREDETGNPVPGNEGLLFFNCPAPVPVGFSPFPCAAR